MTTTNPRHHHPPATATAAAADRPANDLVAIAAHRIAKDLHWQYRERLLELGGELLYPEEAHRYERRGRYHRAVIPRSPELPVQAKGQREEPHGEETSGVTGVHEGDGCLHDAGAPPEAVLDVEYRLVDCILP